jgi:hypothetical protein
MKWSPAWVAGWVVLALSIFAFEMLSLLDGNDATPPLTQVAVRWVPAAVVYAFVAWLAVHFWQSYRSKRDGKP